MLLQLSDVSKSFDGITALSSVCLTVAENEIVGIIGPNGSGKTTLLNVISRLTEPDSGQVNLFDQSVLVLKPYEIARKGLARIFQTPQLCSSLTAFQNVSLGNYARSQSIAKRLAIWRRKDSDATLAAVSDALQFVDLMEGWDELPDRLSHFDRRRLELARVLVGSPKLLLLDEPTSGFAREEREAFAVLVQQTRARGIAIVIVEHDLSLIRQVSDRVIVLDAGTKVAEGSPDIIARDKSVTEVYLGKPHAAN